MNRFYVAAMCPCLLVAAAAQLSGCDDGRYGELVTKPIYADMIALYEGGICYAAGRLPEGPQINVVTVRSSDGGCAVLYLDGVDLQGNLLAYPGARYVHIECNALLSKLRQHHAHARVLARARQICS